MLLSPARRTAHRDSLRRGLLSPFPYDYSGDGARLDSAQQKRWRRVGCPHYIPNRRVSTYET